MPSHPQEGKPSYLSRKFCWLVLKRWIIWAHFWVFLNFVWCEQSGNYMLTRIHKSRARSVKDCSPFDNKEDDIRNSYFFWLMEFYALLLPLLFIAQLTVHVTSICRRHLWSWFLGCAQKTLHKQKIPCTSKEKWDCKTESTKTTLKYLSFKQNVKANSLSQCSLSGAVIEQLNYYRIALDDWFRVKTSLETKLKGTVIYSCLGLRADGDLEYGTVHKIAI